MKEALIDLAHKIISRARGKGFSDLEFYGTWRKEIDIEISRNKIKAVRDRVIIEYGVLGAIGKKIGSIGSEDLSIDVDKLLDQLTSIVKASREDENWKGFARKYGRGSEAPGYDKELENITHEQAVEILVDSMKTATETAKKYGAEEVIVSEGSYSVYIGGVYVANIDGEEQYGEYTANGVGFEVKSRKAGEESSYYVFYQSRKLEVDEIMRESRRGGEYSVKFIGAKPVESGEYTILLDPYMTALFISTALVPAFSALEVQENRSPLKGRLGQQVLSENIEVLDDPTIEWGIGTRPFDDEGIATSKKTLIEKGVLKTYLYNYYTAVRENRESTGNGFRREPSAQTRPGPTNFVLMGRSDLMSEDEMLNEIKKGIIVHGMIGYWMSNYVNGSTQATISHGLLVENGEVKRAVKGVVLGGNIYEWLGKSLRGVGKELRKVGNIYAPAILFEKGKIAG